MCGINIGVSVRFRSKELGTRVKDRAKSFFGSRFISRAVKTESPLPRSFFAPKPNGNACYAGLALSLYGVFPGLLGQCIRQGSHLKGKENI